MKQYDLFGNEKIEVDKKYTTTVKIPVYEPKNKCPFIIELINNSKTKRLISEIEQSSVSQDEKNFLIEAARRHTVFNYTLIADYYSHATPEMQYLMERSALVIIDFMKAVQYGYVKLSADVTQQYLKDYGTDAE